MKKKELKSKLAQLQADYDEIVRVKRSLKDRIDELIAECQRLRAMAYRQEYPEKLEQSFQKPPWAAGHQPGPLHPGEYVYCIKCHKRMRSDMGPCVTEQPTTHPTPPKPAYEQELEVHRKDLAGDVAGIHQATQGDRIEYAPGKHHITTVDYQFDRKFYCKKCDKTWPMVHGVDFGPCERKV